MPTTKGMFNQAGGFAPEAWGPSMWFLVHLIAATYPTNPTSHDRTKYANFYSSLQDVLPCEGCRRGYVAILTTEPTRLTPRIFSSREALFKWTVDVHNRVNAKLGKEVHTDWRAWYREYNRLR